jgi:hypothetical protein
VEDERSLDSAISEEEGVGQLRQRVTVFCHERIFDVSRTWQTPNEN